MKKTLFFILLVIGMYDTTYAQSWQWGVSNRSSFTGGLIAGPTATDPSGNVFVAGDFFNDDSLCIDRFIIYNRYYDLVFAAKYDPDGHALWVVHANYGNGGVWGITVDSAGDLYILGYYNGDSMTVGTRTIYNPDRTIMQFISRISPAGNVDWMENVIESHGLLIAGGGITVDAANNLYITGSYNALTATIGTSTLINNSVGDSTDIFVAKYDTAGNPIWAKDIGGPKHESANSIAASADGNIYILGKYQSSSIVVGPDTLINSYYTPSGYSFVAKLDTSGNEIWGKNAYRRMKMQSLTADVQSNFYVTGSIDTTLIAGTDTFDASGWSHVFLTKYDTSGNMIWANVDSIGPSLGYSVVADACTNVWVAGNTSVGMSFNGYYIDTPAAVFNPMFIAAFDHCGKYIPGTGQISPSGYNSQVALDRTGNIYAGGDYKGVACVYGPDTLVNPGTGRSYLLLAKYAYGTMPCYLDSCVARVTVQVAHANRHDIDIYPNPAHNELIVQYDGNFPDNSKVDVYDITGRIAVTYRLAGTKTVLDIGGLHTGIYQCRLQAGDRTIIKKLSILK